MLPVRALDVPPRELRFHRASGRPSLDLVATIGERWRRRFERLRDVDDLARWFDGAGLPLPRRPSRRDLTRVRELRGAIEMLAVAAMRGGAQDRDAVAVLNAAAAATPPVPILRDGTVEVRTPSATAAASAVARDAVDLLGGPSAARIRECAADDCALLFLDTSRPGTRRWCSMGACGNRAKVSRHRARRRG